MWFVPKCYKQGQSSSVVEIVSSQLKVTLWWEDYEVGRQPGTQLVELSVDKSSAWAAVKTDLSAGSWSISVKAVARKRLVETVLDWEH
jgi:hypothetical protein